MTKPHIETAANLKVDAPDFIVFCAGFEERSLGFLKKLIAEKQVFTAILIGYDPVFQENQLLQATKLLKEARLDFKQFTYSRTEPQILIRDLLPVLSQCKGRLYIDVSAMSRLLIVQIIVALGERECGFVKTSILYAEAFEYPPSEAEARKAIENMGEDPGASVLFLSSGVFEIMIVPELGSPAVTNDRTRLISFPSLEAHHLTALRAELQPAAHSFIEGEPSNTEYGWRRELIAELNGIESLEAEDKERFTVGTMDYEGTIAILRHIYHCHSRQERLILAPTGSKMQTVGVGIFRAYVQDVQIVYPTPSKFRDPARYTVGIGALHELKMDGLVPFPSAYGDQASDRSNLT